MAISKTGTDTSGSGNSATLAFNHTLVAGTNRLVVVCVSLENVGDYDISDVTYGAVAMTKAIDGKTGTSGNILDTEIWYLLDASLPANGVNSVSISGTGVASSLEINGWCGEYIDALQDVPEATDSTMYTGTATAIQNDIAPSAGSWIISCMGCGNTSTTWTHGLSQVELLDFNDSSSSFAVAELRSAAGSETAITSTVSGTVNRSTRMAASFKMYAETPTGPLVMYGLLLRVGG